MAFKIRLLGPGEVLRDGCAVALGRAKPRALLAALALKANQTVSLEALIDILWAGRPPASAVANLRSYAAGLRQAISDRLLTRTRGYLLRLNDNELDTHEFTRLATDGRASLSRGDTATATAQLSAALSLWRGPAGNNLGTGTTLDTQFATLDQQRLDVFEAYIDAAMNHTTPAKLTAQLREHLTRDPLRERAWAQLMLLYYRGGEHRIRPRRLPRRPAEATPPPRRRTRTGPHQPAPSHPTSRSPIGRALGLGRREHHLATRPQRSDPQGSPRICA